LSQLPAATMADKKVETTAEVKEPQAVGEIGPTLVEVAEKRAGGKRKLLSRVAIAASMPDGTPLDKVAAHFKGIFHNKAGSINGACLVYHDHVASILEGPPTSIMYTLRELGKDAGPMTDVSVVCSVEDCPDQCFSGWKCKSTSFSDPDLHMDDLVYASYDIYSSLVNIGKKSIDIEESSDVPSLEKIAAMCKHADISSIEDWLDMYDSPISVTLESENIWPLQPFVQY